MSAMRSWLPAVVALAWACASSPNTSEQGDRGVMRAWQVPSYVVSEEMILSSGVSESVNWRIELSEVLWQRQRIIRRELTLAAANFDAHDPSERLQLSGFEGGIGLGSAMAGPGTPFDYVFTHQGQEYGDELAELLKPPAPRDESSADSTRAWLAALERFLPPSDARAVDGWMVHPAAISALMRPARRGFESWSLSSSGGKADAWTLMTGWLCTPEQWGDSRGELDVVPVDRGELEVAGEEAFRVSIHVWSDRDLLADDALRELVARVDREAGREVNAYIIGTTFQGTGLLLWNCIEQRLVHFAMDGQVEVTTRASGAEGSEELYLRGTYTFSIAPRESSDAAAARAE